MISNLFSIEVTQAIGWTLVHCLWQLAIIYILFSVVISSVRSSVLRHRIGIVALACCVLVPAITFSHLIANEPRITFLADSIGDGSGSNEAVYEESSNAPPEAAQPVFPTGNSRQKSSINTPKFDQALRESPTSKTMHLEDWFPGIVTMWLAGMFLFAMRPLFGALTAPRLRRDGKPVSDQIQSFVRQACKNMKIRRKVSAVISHRVAIPMVTGLLKPVILLPASMLSSLTMSEIEAILRHELAHVKRNDAIINLLQVVTESVLFFHPAVWLISRSIRTERENCCDDLAARPVGMESTLAKALLKLEETRVSTTSLAANGGNLKSRIERLLVPDGAKTGIRSRGHFIPLLVLATVATVLAATSFLILKSETVSVETPLANANVSSENTDDKYKETEGQLNEIIGRLSPINQQPDLPRFSPVDYINTCRLLLGLPAERRTKILGSWTNNHDEQVIILCRMLFEAKGGKDFRRPHLGAAEKGWPLEPIAIVDEIPFLVVDGYTLCGEAESSSMYLQYCLENCKWTERTYPRSDYRSIRSAMAKLVAEKTKETNPRLLRHILPQLTGQRYSDVVEQAAEYLALRLNDDGSWSTSDVFNYQVGPPSLYTLALLRSHLAFDNRVALAVDRVSKMKPDSTYEYALQTLVLCEADPTAYSKQIQKNVDSLISRQSKEGGWGYGRFQWPAGACDNSNTRFAVWGLFVAQQHGFETANEVWKNIANYWLKGQGKDGAWSYHSTPSASRRTMTLSGIACLSMCLKSTELTEEISAQAKEAIVRAWACPKLENAMKSQFPLYAANIYSLASNLTDRNLADLDTSQIKDRSWFESQLAGLQSPSGTFRTKNSPLKEASVQTSLAILAITECAKR